MPSKPQEVEGGPPGCQLWFLAFRHPSLGQSSPAPGHLGPPGRDAGVDGRERGVQLHLDEGSEDAEPSWARGGCLGATWAGVPGPHHLFGPTIWGPGAGSGTVEKAVGAVDASGPPTASDLRELLMVRLRLGGNELHLPHL